jgi:hypothetical protein
VVTVAALIPKETLSVVTVAALILYKILSVATFAALIPKLDCKGGNACSFVPK